MRELAEVDVPIQEEPNIGTCGFCGIGGGYLGEMGDDRSEILHAAVRFGTPGKWTYKPHPNAYDEHKQLIRWCGGCVKGLIHKYERYDDTNLNALYVSNKVRLELDGVRWSNWEDDETRDVLKKVGHVDDTAIHMDKLHISDKQDQIYDEMCRRAGFDLTSREHWRP